VPHLSFDSASSLAQDGDNFYSKLLNLKDAETGKDFFKKFTFVLSNFNDLPQWQSSRKHAKIRAMMADQQELMEQETYVGGADALRSVLSLTLVWGLAGWVSRTTRTSAPLRRNWWTA